MRALGYPCRATLTAWVREALPKTRRTVVGSVGQRSYPATFKQAGIVALCTRQESAQAVADELGVCRPTLYKWKNQLLGREAPASMKRKNNSPPATERAELGRQLEALQREIRQLQLEQDLLNKANELLKKGLGVDLQLLSNREKTLLIDALREHYGLPKLLAQLGLARSSYFYHRARTAVDNKYRSVRQAITDIFESNHRCYGYRRLQASLTRQDALISEKVVQSPSGAGTPPTLARSVQHPRTSSTAISRPQHPMRSGSRTSRSSRSPRQGLPVAPHRLLR
jgi:putative transposase